MLTGRGRSLLAGGVLLYLAGGITGSRSLYLLSASSLALILLAVGSVFLARRKITLTREIVTPRVFAGEEVEEELVVENPGRVPVSSLLLVEEGPSELGGGISARLPPVPPGGRRKGRVKRKARRRGRFVLGPVRAVLSDPFRLVQAGKLLALPLEVLVLPRVERLEGLPGSLPLAGGSSEGARPGHASQEFYAVRDWVPGEGLRRVHWPSVAKTAKLMVREEEMPALQRAAIVLETRVSRLFGVLGEDHASGFEGLVEAAASACWHLGRLGFGLILATPAGVLPPFPQGIRGAVALLQTLALLEPREKGSLVRCLSALEGRASSGLLLALLASLGADELRAMTRLGSRAAWCGAVLLEGEGSGPGGHEEAEKELAASGWRVVRARAGVGFQGTWKKLLGVGYPSRFR